jgi:hypothetical protein
VVVARAHQIVNGPERSDVRGGVAVAPESPRHKDGAEARLAPPLPGAFAAALDQAVVCTLDRGAGDGVLSFAKTPSAGQVVDLSALIQRESRSHDHHAAPPYTQSDLQESNSLLRREECGWTHRRPRMTARSLLTIYENGPAVKSIVGARVWSASSRAGRPRQNRPTTRRLVHDRRSPPSAPRVGRMTHRALALGPGLRSRPIAGYPPNRLIPPDPDPRPRGAARSLKTLTPVIET